MYVHTCTFFIIEPFFLTLNWQKMTISVALGDVRCSIVFNGFFSLHFASRVLCPYKQGWDWLMKLHWWTHRTLFAPLNLIAVNVHTKFPTSHDMLKTLLLADLTFEVWHDTLGATSGRATFEQSGAVGIIGTLDLTRVVRTYHWTKYVIRVHLVKCVDNF